jgi:KDO2-lipid IV(A) lauroyltransferase
MSDKKRFQGIYTYPLLAMIYGISYLPFHVLYFISDFLYILLYRIFAYRVKVCNANLKKALPYKTEEEIKIIEKKFYKHLCDVIVETIKSFTISPKELKKRMKLLNPEVLAEVYRTNRKMIAVTGHYGNWEWAAITLPFQSQYNAQGVYLAIKNPIINRAMIKSRSRFGIDLLEAGKIYQELENRKSTLSITGFIADQSPSKPEKGIWMHFLNQETVVASGTERYAALHEMAVAFGKIRKIKRGYYTLEYELVTENAAIEKAGAVTQKHTQILEKIIQEEPQFWLWSHKRWKHKRPAETPILSSHE